MSFFGSILAFTAGVEGTTGCSSTLFSSVSSATAKL